jgi:acyl-CoA synthetase (AMP-forming)/AMP-acid ligase II
MSSLPNHHSPFADTYRTRGDWITYPVPDPLRAVAAHSPDRLAVVDRQGLMTYGELDSAVQRFAACLWEKGLRPGARISIQLPNWREFVIAQQAASRIGAAYVPLLPQLREADVAYALEASEAQVLVIPSIYKDFDYQGMAKSLNVKHVFAVGASFDEALAHPWEKNHSEEINALTIDPDALRIILFTSGTESKPKGILHSYNTQYFGLKRHVDYFKLDSNDVVMCASPVGHGTGAVNGVEFAIHLGGCVVMMEKWHPATGLHAIIEHGATLMWGAATFYSDLVDAARRASVKPERFRYAFSAGAPIPRQLITSVRDTLGAKLISAYGQSEGQNIAIARLGDGEEKITGSDGCIHDSIVWKLVDANRKAISTGEAGEIAYRGPNVCLGFLDPEHQAAAFDDEGFIYSGDLGRVDAEAYLRIVGRSKEIIIRGGENISPAEIEDILFAHPMIEKVAIVAYPDDRLGQRACAAVVPRPGCTPTLDNIIDYMSARKVAKFKYPEKLVLMNAMPMTESGKVKRKALQLQLFGNNA